MSTISDALKKAQKNRLGESHGTVPHSSVPPPPPSTSHPPATASSSRLTVAVVAVLVLCLMMFLVVTRTKNPSHQPSPPRGEGAVRSAPDSPLSSPLGGEDSGEGSVVVEPVAVKPPPPEVIVPLPAPPPPPPPAPEPVPPPTPLPVLSGTFYSEVNPVAIINGFSLKEGETVGAYRVVKILPRSVILKYSGGEIELRLQ